jgi:hypothetical protein
MRINLSAIVRKESKIALLVQMQFFLQSVSVLPLTKNGVMVNLLTSLTKIGFDFY